MNNTQNDYQKFLLEEVKRLEDKLESNIEVNKERLETIIRIVSRSYQYDYAKAHKYIQKGYKIAEVLNETNLLFILKFHDAQIAYKKFDNNQALKLYFECLTYFEQKKETFYYHTLYGLGEVFFHLREFQKSKELLTQVYSYYDAINDEKMIASKTGQLTNLLFEMGEYNKTEILNNRCLLLSKKHKHYTGLSFAYLIKARLALVKNDDVKFKSNINLSLKYAKNGYVLQYLNALCIKAQYYYSKRKYNEMKLVLDEILANNIEDYQSGTNIEVYEMLYGYYEKNNMYKDANKILKLIYELKDNQSISISMYSKIQELQKCENLSIYFSTLYFYDITNKLSKLDIPKIYEVDYLDRICTINQSSNDKVQKYGAFNQFINLLNSNAESPNIFFKINSKNKAINLNFFHSLNETKKTVTINYNQHLITYPISSRQIVELKKIVNILP